MNYDFSSLAAYIDSLHSEKKLPGGDVIVCYKGVPVFRHMVGTATEDNLYYLFSCSKPVAVTAAMQLVEKEIIALDDPVCRYFPNYADAVYEKDGKLTPVGETMKLRHLFTMSAGLNYNVESDAVKKVVGANPNASMLDIIPAFVESMVLQAEPGTRFRYSLCHDVLAGVVEIASGMRYSEYLKKNIFEPLGMESATFRIPKEKEHLTAQQYDVRGDKLVAIPNGIFGFRITPSYEAGGAGIICTTADYGKFAAAMSCGGVSADGVRILKAETVDLLRTPQLDEKNEFGCGAGPGYAYGYGVRTLTTNEFGAKSKIGEFGWDGAAGSYILMDPDSQVGIVYTQQVLSWTRYFGCMHAPIRDSVYEALKI